MKSDLRVWVSGVDDHTGRVVKALDTGGLTVRSSINETDPTSELTLIRWADVVVIVADSESLAPSQALLYGMAVATSRPVLFIGPEVVRFPIVTSASYTLLDPVESEALLFQVESLGSKRSEQRAKRASQETHFEDKPRVRSSKRALRRSEVTGESSNRRAFDSLLEGEVFAHLQHDPGVLEIAADTRAREHPAQSVADFLLWVEGASPFNPVPVEVKGTASARDIDRLFDVLEATKASIGALVSEGGAVDREPELIERNGRLVVMVRHRALGGSIAMTSSLIRQARNALVHRSGNRAEL